MKITICTILGLCGAGVATVFGGWTTGMITLCIAMVMDYIMGLTLAAVFKKSKKTESGGLESRAGWKGLVRKVATLLIVGLMYRLDITIGTDYLRDAVIIGFLANEVISIVENAGLMGLPLPGVISKAIEVLKAKEMETK